MDNQQVSELELGWLAGAFDADGHIGMYIYDYKKTGSGWNARVEVGFTNTDEDFLCKVLSICGRLGGNLHISKKARIKGKEYWTTAWVVRTSKFTIVHRLLNHLIPFLTCKKERAELLLSFCARRLKLADDLYDGNLMSLARGYGYTGDDIWYFEKMKELNKKPTPTTIPKGSRAQEGSKLKAQVDRLTCDDIV